MKYSKRLFMLSSAIECIRMTAIIVSIITFLFSTMKGFMEFVREQGVVGLAVGFILGGSVSKVVTSLVSDLINPILGLILGSTKGLESAYLNIFGAKMMYGHFLSVLLDFIVIAAVVYYVVHGLKLDRLDKKKG